MKNNNLRVLLGLFIILLTACFLLMIFLLRAPRKQAVMETKETVSAPLQEAETDENLQQADAEEALPGLPSLLFHQQPSKTALQDTPSQQISEAQAQENCVRKNNLHKNNLEPKDRQGKPYLSKEDISCPEVVQGYVLRSLSCQKVQFANQEKSILYFSNDILRSRDDFDSTGALTARYLFEPTETLYHNPQNKDCPVTTESKSFVSVAELYPSKDRTSVFFYTPQHTIQFFVTANFAKPETITVDFDKDGIFQSYENIDNKSRVVNDGNTRVTIKLDANTAQKTYTKSVLHNGPNATEQVTTGTWTLQPNGVVQLDNGQRFSPASKWGNAKTYCQIYPQDCEQKI